MQLALYRVYERKGFCRKCWYYARVLFGCYRERALCVPVRRNGGGTTEVLLIQSKSGRWTLPGGGVDVGETKEEGSQRELLEEAGVVGTVGMEIGVYVEAAHMSRTTAFVVDVTEERQHWDEDDRQRAWFPLEEVQGRLKERYQRIWRDYVAKCH